MKNKIAIVAILISLIAMSAYAEALFENAYLSDLRVIKADEQAGWALILRPGRQSRGCCRWGFDRMGTGGGCGH